MLMAKPPASSANEGEAKADEVEVNYESRSFRLAEVQITAYRRANADPEGKDQWVFDIPQVLSTNSVGGSMPEIPEGVERELIVDSVEKLDKVGKKLVQDLMDQRNELRATTEKAQQAFSKGISSLVTEVVGGNES